MHDEAVACGDDVDRCERRVGERREEAADEFPVLVDSGVALGVVRDVAGGV